MALVFFVTTSTLTGPLFLDLLYVSKSCVACCELVDLDQSARELSAGKCGATGTRRPKLLFFQAVTGLQFAFDGNMAQLLMFALTATRVLADVIGFNAGISAWDKGCHWQLAVLAEFRLI